MANNIENASFYYDQGIAGQISYSDYQQRRAMTQDITDAIDRSDARNIAANAIFTGELQSTLINNQIASENALYNNTQNMIGAFYSGFSDVSRQIGIMGANMSMAFAALNTTVQKSAQAIYDRLDTMNDILNNPSLTKSRELFRRAAVNYNKGFYEEARNDLLDALASNKTDYISWFLLGKTYLFGAGEFSNVIDLEKAIEALKNAVKYITPDARKQEEAKVMAAEMCFYLGLAQQTRAMDALHAKNEADCRVYLEQAGVSYGQSWDYSAKMLEARYNRARCKALLGDAQGAITDLETLVLADRNYCVKVCADKDFSIIVIDLITKLKKVAFIPAKEDYDNIKTMLSELASLGGTTEVTIPTVFTEEIPYFDILDYAKDFKRIIPIVEKAMAYRKAAIAKAEQAERERQARAEREARKAKEKAEREARAVAQLPKAREWIVKYEKYKVCISAGYHTVGLKNDSSIVAVGDNWNGQCNVSGWRDIVAVVAGKHHTVVLKANGTVVAVGENKAGQGNVSGWCNIVAVAAGDFHTVGLKADGMVVAVGDNEDGRCNVCAWRDIVAVATGRYHTVGLKANGMVVAVGDNKDGQCDVSDWHGIVAVAAGYSYTVGLIADSTVIAVGNDFFGQCNVSDWRDIVAVAASGHTVGLQADGTVIAVGNNKYGQCDVGSWLDIVAVAAGGSHTAGLKADGTVVAVGDNENGQCNVSTWRDIGPFSEEATKERAEREAKGEELYNKLRQEEWQEQGLCKYCGGKLGGLFTKKCKSCGKEN